MRTGMLRRIWRYRRRAARERVEIDRDPLDALGDEIISAMVRRIDDRMADAGLIAPRGRDPHRRPTLYIIENSDDTDDPLRAIGIELIAAGHRMNARQEAARRARARRRHQLAVAASTVLFLMVGASAASTVIDGTTGIPALDRFLAFRDERIGNPTRRVPAGASRAPHLATRSDAEVVSHVQLRFQSKAVDHFDVVNYVLADGQTCIALVEGAVGPSSRTLPATRLTCQPTPRLVDRMLAQKGAYVVGLRGLYEQTVYFGYALSDTRRVFVLNGRKSLPTRLSPAFSLPGSTTEVRLFAATKPRAPGASVGANLQRIKVRAR
jgi:hypothetical protein